MQCSLVIESIYLDFEVRGRFCKSLENSLDLKAYQKSSQKLFPVFLKPPENLTVKSLVILPRKVTVARIAPENVFRKLVSDKIAAG